jgi:hypothetical protein
MNQMEVPASVKSAICRREIRAVWHKSCARSKWAQWSVPGSWSKLFVADVTGDGKDDIVGFDYTGKWWQFQPRPWSVPGDGHQRTIVNFTVAPCARDFDCTRNANINCPAANCKVRAVLELLICPLRHAIFRGLLEG